MTPDEYEELRSLYFSVAELDPHARTPVLDEACDGNPALRDKVDELLRDTPDATAKLGEMLRHVDAHTDASPQTASPVAEKLPRQFGRYHLVAKLGQGGMGTVYEAEQDNPKRSVALKVITAGTGSRTTQRRFQREVQVLGRLQHRCIAQVYEAGTVNTNNGPQSYYAMELVRGDTLIDYANAEKLSTRDRLALIAEIGEAVHHAHQRGVIHRDLKPDNILIDASGVPKVLDFGIAFIIDADLKAATLTTVVGQLVGTVAYMSPEQASGDPREVDVRSDVYSLGVVLFELLTGRLPHDTEGKRIYDVVRDIREEPAPRLGFLDRSLRGDLEIVVAKALEKDKERRYQSALDLVDDVRRYLGDEPIVARHATLSYQLRMMVKRRPALFTSAAVLIVLVTAFLGYGWTKNRQLAAERQTRLESAARSLEAYRLFEEASDLSERHVHFGRAKGLLSRAVQLDPDFAIGYFELAELKRGRVQRDHSEPDDELFQQILDDYKAAHAAAGEDGFPRALLAAGAFCRDHRRLDEALDFFTAATDAGLEDVYARVARAEVLEFQHRRDEALELLQELTKDPIGSQMAEVWGSLGRIYIRQRLATNEAENPKANSLLAEQALREAARIDPQNYAYWNALGLACRDIDKHEEALAAYRRVAELAPDRATGFQNVSIVLRERDRLPEAIEWAKKGVGLSGSMPANIADLAYMCKLAHRPSESREWWRRYVDEVPDDLRGYTEMVEIAGDMGEDEAALAAAHDASIAMPEDARAWHLLGAEQLRQGQIDEAEGSFTKGRQVSQPTVENEIGMAQVEEARDRYTSADKILSNALDQFPNEPKALMAAGKLRWNHFDRESSRRFFTQAMQCKLDMSYSYALLGNQMSEVGAYDLALAARERALAVFPEDKWSKKYLAWFLLTAKDRSVRDPQRALILMEDIQKALRNMAEPADCYALALLRTGRNDEAAKVIEEGIAEHGDDVHRLLWAAIAHARLNDMNRARMQYYTALARLEEEPTEDSDVLEFLVDAKALIEAPGEGSTLPSDGPE